MEAVLIDRIYECSFVPEMWPQVLRDTSKLSGSSGAVLFVTNPEVTSWTASPNAHEITDRFVREGWYWRGQLTKRVHGTRHAGFLRDIDLLPMDELAEEPIYRDNWRHIGLGWGAATAMPLPGGDSLSFVLPRQIAKGPADAEAIARLDMLRPHLARAALMAARLRLERARAAADALLAIGLAALVLDESGRVLAANALAEAISGVMNWRARDRIALVDASADALLHEALQRLGTTASDGSRSFPIQGSKANGAAVDGEKDAGTLMVGHVIPVRLSARDIFSRGVAMFVIAPVEAPGAPPVELVRSLFDLTPSEARVARGLAGGRTVDELAQEGNVSANTVRAQVRGVLEKTGCNRQADVVALLAGVSAVKPQADI